MKLFFLLLSLSLLNCAGSPSGDKKSEKTPAAAAESDEPAQRPLTQQEATLRSQAIHDVSYQIWIDLRNDASFSGKNTIRFQLGNEPRDLFLDFSEGKVKHFTVNGQEIQLASYDNDTLPLPRAALHWGTANEVTVEYEHPYSHNGNGLHQFKDPVDGKRYLYTDFEPFHAHLFIPCFDQPDLKATYEISADTPAGWQVISSTLEKSKQEKDGFIHWEFPVSDRFSTYLVSLHAGPYAVWKDQAGQIPLRLFARQSLAKYMDAPEWFTVTKQGLAFYGKAFSYPYPFHKYDQIVVPDFNAGAMENVAAVTFSERTIYRSRETQDRHMNRAETILHEMAHMWFGDLVTMKWWNDLWLNESFATFMSAWAVDKATHFPGAWQAFYGEKTWALREDQLVTTHPIEGDVPNTDAAMSSFDGITYGKGASVLKQLFYLLGEANFRAGLKSYFQAHAFGNATLEDFMGSMSAASGRDLKEWQKLWLETAGVNSVTPEFSCEAGKVKTFSIHQEPDEASHVLRPHRTEVGFYYREGNKLVLRGKYPVEYAAAETSVKSLEGRRCPDFVYTNQDDYDYAKVILDKKSLAVAKTDLAGLQDPFLREQVWNSLHQMVTDGKLSAQELLMILVAEGKGEPNTKTLHESLDLRYVLLEFLDSGVYDIYRDRLEKFFAEGLAQAEPGSDAQLIWFGAFVETARSAPNLARLENWLSGQEKLRGLKIDQERRWDILRTLARWNRPGVAEKLAQEEKRDPTDSGHKQGIAAQVKIPTEANKQKWLALISRQNQGEPLKVAEIRPAMENFYAREQEKIEAPATGVYFDTIQKGRSAEENFIGRFARGMFPPFCEVGLSARASAFLEQNANFPIYITKPVKIGRQDNDRCVRGRALSRQVGDIP